jgi:hypothetical protein
VINSLLTSWKPRLGATCAETPANTNTFSSSVKSSGRRPRRIQNPRPLWMSWEIFLNRSLNAWGRGNVLGEMDAGGRLRPGFVSDRVPMPKLRAYSGNIAKQQGFGSVRLVTR